MTTYTFAELLNHFFYTQQSPERRITQAELAEAVGISRRAMAAWFSGSCLPQTEEQVQRVATALVFSPLQRDLFLHAINPLWIQDTTSLNLLESIELNLNNPTRDQNSVPIWSPLILSATFIEARWAAYFYEDFATNHQRWGVGSRDNGCGRMTRQIANQRYKLALHNRYHEDVYMGGDSNCFAPTNYYYSVHVRSTATKGTRCGYGLIVNGINDEYHTFFRICEQLCLATIVQTFPGTSPQRYLRQLPLPTLHPGKLNKIAILAIQDEHWLYINDRLAGYQRLPRISIGRLDVGLAAGVGEEISCEFEKLRVLIPQASAQEPS